MDIQGSGLAGYRCCPSFGKLTRANLEFLPLLQSWWVAILVGVLILSAHVVREHETSRFPTIHFPFLGNVRSSLLLICVLLMVGRSCPTFICFISSSQFQP